MFQNYHRMEVEILSSYQNHEVTQCQSIKYINLPSVYEQVENAKKKKNIWESSYQHNITFSTERNRFPGRHDGIRTDD